MSGWMQPFNRRPGLTIAAVLAAMASSPVLFADGSAAAPSISFASDPDTGFFASAAGVGLIDVSVSGNQRYQFSPSRFQMGAGQQLGWSAGFTPGTVDVVLLRDAAGALALRNGTAAQTLRIYNTYTDASNYERGALYWNGNVLTLTASAAGTGTNRDIAISSPATLYLGSNGATRWRVSIAGHLVANVDNSYDLGTSGALRPRNAFFSGYVVQGVVAIASLPAAGTAGAGARMIVNDASGPTFGSTVSGGGAAVVPVYSDGTNWLVG